VGGVTKCAAVGGELPDDDAAPNVKEKSMATGRLDPPQASIADRLHTLARAGIASMPYFGAATAELFNMVIAPPLQKRQQRWMDSIADYLFELDQKGVVRLEGLSSNGAFLDAIMQATQAALRTREEGKIEALRNAVLNSALPGPPEDYLQKLFLNLVDIFSCVHLRVLSTLAAQLPYSGEGPQAHVLGREAPMGAVQHVSDKYILTILRKGIPESADKHDIYSLVCQDLYDRSLIHFGSTDGPIPTWIVRGGIATALGLEFLKFVTAPQVPAPAAPLPSTQ
jgi:hypothetical protein